MRSPYVGFTLPHHTHTSAREKKESVTPSSFLQSGHSILSFTSVAFSLYYLDNALSMWLNYVKALQLTWFCILCLHRLRAFLNLDQFDYLLMQPYPCYSVSYCCVRTLGNSPKNLYSRAFCSLCLVIFITSSYHKCGLKQFGSLQSNVILRLNPQYLMADKRDNLYSGKGGLRFCNLSTCPAGRRCFTVCVHYSMVIPKLFDCGSCCIGIVEYWRVLSS